MSSYALYDFTESLRAGDVEINENDIKTVLRAWGIDGIGEYNP